MISRTTFAAGGLAVLAATLLAAQASSATRVHRLQMGTSMSVEAIGGDETARQAAIDDAFAAIAEVDRVMSHYRSASDLSRVNRLAADQAVRVPPSLFEVLTIAQDVSRASGGAFDVSVGPLVKGWGFFDHQPRLPTARELERIRPLVDYRLVTLDATARTVRFARRGMELDLGGIAKGYALDLAARALSRRGLSGSLDAGGNQFFVGTPQGKPRWTVGIADPDRRGELIGTLSLAGGAVATSGNYQNFFDVRGKRYGHILDPRTLQPSDRSLSVTVVAADGAVADALTKPLFILGPESGLRLAQSFGAAAIIVTRASSGETTVALSERLRGLFRAVRPK